MGGPESKLDEKAENTMDTKDRLELICWLIDRVDKLRDSVATRAAIVVSANALLLAGTTFLLGQAGQHSPAEKVFLAISIGITFLLLAFSLIYATTGIISLWTTNRQQFGGDAPQQLFINAFASTEIFSSYKPFEESFRKTSEEQMMVHALGSLWLDQNMYYKRHQQLRRAIKLLLLAIIFFFISIGILLFEFIK